MDVEEEEDEEDDEEDDEEGLNPPKGRDFDLNQIRSELKGFTKVLKISPGLEEKTIDSAASSDESDIKPIPVTPPLPILASMEGKDDKPEGSASSSEDIYEFKEPEPFEFETHKIIDDKSKKRLVPRVLDTIEKTPKKKSPKSTTKQENKDSDEKKRYRRTPVKKEESDDRDVKPLIFDDPFDKLVESPSFHVGKSTNEKSEEVRKVSKVLNLDEPLNLFKELPPISVDDGEERLDISDVEDHNEPLFTHKEHLFSETAFSTKESPEHTVSDCSGYTSKMEEKKPLNSDYDELLQETIQNVLTFDNDSNDGLLNTHPDSGTSNDYG